MLDEIRWKFVTVFSISAMALSMLSGGLSGIGLEVILIRALISGLVFALIAALLNVIVSRYFPEFFTSEEMFSGDEESLGQHVDIMSDDEIDHSPVDYSKEVREDNVEKVMENVIDVDEAETTLSQWDALPNKEIVSTEEILGSDHDPAEIAKAIQTVINRDEKG